MVVAGKFKDLREQTLKNRRDKKFWTLLHEGIQKFNDEKRERNRRNYYRRRCED